MLNLRARSAKRIGAVCASGTKLLPRRGSCTNRDKGQVRLKRLLSRSRREAPVCQAKNKALPGLWWETSENARLET